jgi:hypothetical protein
MKGSRNQRASGMKSQPYECHSQIEDMTGLIHSKGNIEIEPYIAKHTRVILFSVAIDAKTVKSLTLDTIGLGLELC